MGDKENERKRRARVLSVPVRKAVVISHGLRDRVVGLSSRDRKTVNPDMDKFVRSARELLGVNSDYGFNREDMRRTTMAFELAPLRIIFELRSRTVQFGRIGTWMLFLRDMGDNTVRVYSPREGVKGLRIQAGVHTLYNFMFNDDNDAQFEKSAVLNPPPESAYEIPEEPLLRLGAIQKTSADCGPLCLYAARFARRRQS